jgi:hypothetical protein
MNFLKKWGHGQGYSVAVLNSQTGKNATIRCDRGGHHIARTEDAIARKTASKRTGCTFLLYTSCPTAQKTTPGHQPKPRYWTLKIRNPVHDEHAHPPSKEKALSTQHEKMTKVQREQAMFGIESQQTNRQILAAINKEKNPDFKTQAAVAEYIHEKVQSKTISNLRLKIHKERLAGRQPIEAAIDLLQSAEWAFIPHSNSDGKLQRLFFAHPGSMELAKIFHHVCIVDSTYKSNRFKLPLLQAVSQTSTGHTFTIGFCLLRDEDEVNYVWAMEQFGKIWANKPPAVFVTDQELALTNALDKLFPESKRILCYWHVLKNVKTHCRKYCSTEEDWDGFYHQFMALCHCKTEAEFLEKWDALRDKLYVSSRSTLDYLEANVYPIKERCMGPWANRIPHLGNSVTSRVESAHSAIKSYLTDSQGVCT